MSNAKRIAPWTGRLFIVNKRGELAKRGLFWTSRKAFIVLRLDEQFLAWRRNDPKSWTDIRKQESVGICLRACGFSLGMYLT